METNIDIYEHECWESQLVEGSETSHICQPISPSLQIFWVQRKAYIFYTHLGQVLAFWNV